VALHCADGDNQFGGDLRIRETAGDQAHHLPLCQGVEHRELGSSRETGSEVQQRAGIAAEASLASAVNLTQPLRVTRSVVATQRLS
jgi:hypothetical protein